jgi:DNA-binding MarR family transcriptional regulator
MGEQTDVRRPDDEQVRAWAAVLRVHAAVVPRLERDLAAVGMPLSWYDVLLELNAAPDRRLRMTELGARAVLSRERVSRVVDELERAGLVRRERNPDDGRSLLAVITDEGRARLRAAAPAYLAGIERHFGAHVGDDAATVADALLRVVEAAAAADRPAPAREPVQIGRVARRGAGRAG